MFKQVSSTSCSKTSNFAFSNAVSLALSRFQQVCTDGVDGAEVDAADCSLLWCRCCNQSIHQLKCQVARQFHSSSFSALRIGETVPDFTQESTAGKKKKKYQSKCTCESKS